VVAGFGGTQTDVAEYQLPILRLIKFVSPENVPFQQDKIG
jgi:hypothetical protein